jgi:hypothetical protein
VLTIFSSFSPEHTQNTIIHGSGRMEGDAVAAAAVVPVTTEKRTTTHHFFWRTNTDRPGRSFSSFYPTTHNQTLLLSSSAPPRPPAHPHNAHSHLKTTTNISVLCCGSGSGIRCLFDPWIRDEQPGSYFRELRNNFWVQIPKFFDADPVYGMEKIRIRDKHPGSAILKNIVSFVNNYRGPGFSYD